MKILGTRLSKPEIWGFPDLVQIFNSDTGDMEIYNCPRFGTNPNPVGPTGGPNAGQPWYEFEGQLAAGSYKYECWLSPKHGKCLKLNDLGPVATTRPNPADGGLMIARAVEIHCGFRPDIPGHLGWRGSLCCNVVSPEDWPVFISHFKLGDVGEYELIDKSND